MGARRKKLNGVGWVGQLPPPRLPLSSVHWALPRRLCRSRHHKGHKGSVSGPASSLEGLYLCEQQQRRGWPFDKRRVGWQCVRVVRPAHAGLQVSRSSGSDSGKGLHSLFVVIHSPYLIARSVVGVHTLPLDLFSLRFCIEIILYLYKAT